jgi:IclR family acetate operon transcriptional repressor
VLLADLSDEDLMQVLRRHGLTKYTENTILTVTALKEHLAQVRQKGYGLDNEETYLGVKCLAAPIRDRSGRVTASAGISGPVQRMTDERLRVLAEIVVEVCSRVSARMGASTPVLVSA